MCQQPASTESSLKTVTRSCMRECYLLDQHQKSFSKSRWRIELEQYSDSASSDAWKNWKGTQASGKEKEMKIETFEEQCSSSSWQQQANIDIRDFEIDLQIEAVPDDIVQKDEKRMQEINDNMSKLRIGSRAECLREDRSKKRRRLDFQRRVRTHNLRHGQRGTVRIGKNYSDRSVPVMF